jgi:DNA-binding response OmpR family regulator
VVDDEPNLLQLARINLTHEGYEVDLAPSLTAAQEKFEASPPDLVIVDLYFGAAPGGIDLARWIRGRSDIPILFLTASDSVDNAIAGFDSGADDYVRKPVSPRELVARVGAILRRSGRSFDGAIQVGLLDVDTAGHVASWDGHALELTKTEFDILTLLARQAGRVVSKEQVLSDVWGSPHYTVNVVEVHISSLRRKGERAAGTQPIETVRGVGYVLRA